MKVRCKYRKQSSILTYVKLRHKLSLFKSFLYTDYRVVFVFYDSYKIKSYSQMIEVGTVSTMEYY